jgi:exosome complex component RRP46
MPEIESIMRKFQTEIGLITRADGSAQFSQGGTTVIAGTYGPVEVKPHKELPGNILNRFPP